MAKPAKLTRQAAASKPRAQRISPALCIGFGTVLMLGAGLIHWWDASQEAAEAAIAASRAAERQAAQAAQQKALDKALAEHKARVRAEQEKIEAQAAAAEAARRALMVDGPSEAKAKAEREEAASKQAAVTAVRRAEAETEEAWKRFYKPSTTCADPAASASVECVNAYIKAKREFEASRATGRANSS